MGFMSAWDLTLFRWINHWPEWLNPVMQFFSKGTQSPAMIAILAIVLVTLLAKPATRKGGLVAGAGWVLANEATDLWKSLLPFGRPGNELSDAIVRVGMSQSMGTASAHSANMAFVAFAFCWYFGKWGSPWVLVALLTGLSRIYVAAHYPSQVLLGWATGSLAAWAVCATVDRLTQPKARPDATSGGESAKASHPSESAS